MTTLLAIDASSSACSVALWQDGVVTAERCEAPRQHTQLMMPMIETLLADAQLTLKDLDALAYGHGPGSFTGLRIAAGTIQGLAFGLEVPVIGVSTLAALALQAHRHHHARFVLPMLDARMGELYTGAYRVATSAEGEVEVSQLLPEQVVAPGLVELPRSFVSTTGWPSVPGWSCTMRCRKPCAPASCSVWRHRSRMPRTWSSWRHRPLRAARQSLPSRRSLSICATRWHGADGARDRHPLASVRWSAKAAVRFQHHTAAP
ncbi:tRNA (adenosine(37)-N6)-threonylcarbamoyltransferase complex dimerization subunit type 1 TsaB [Cobetia marina]